MEVIVNIGQLHGRGIIENDEYEVSARLTGNVSDIDTENIKFLLPEFTFDGREDFRLDSTHEYRDTFPNCRNRNGRLLGAKLINNEWKGAIFIYYTQSSESLETVKNELRARIIVAVNQKISASFQAA